MKFYQRHVISKQARLEDAEKVLAECITRNPGHDFAVEYTNVANQVEPYRVIKRTPLPKVNDQERIVKAGKLAEKGKQMIHDMWDTTDSGFYL